MVDTQLYLAIGVPVVMNAAMLTLALTIAVTAINKRIDSLEARLDIAIGKLAEVDTRLSILEDRWKR